MAGSSYPIKINGYIYSAGTRKGFQRMKRQGIPRPLFRIEDKLARILAAHYKKIVRSVLESLRGKLRAKGIATDAAPDGGLEGLLTFFEEMGAQLRAENEAAERRAAFLSAAKSLEEEWAEEDREELERLDDLYTGEIGDDLRAKVSRVLKENQEDYMKRLFDDADERLLNVIRSFSLDKQKFFDGHLEAVRTLYLDNSLQRIAGEQDLIRRNILERITGYALGDAQELDLTDLMRSGLADGDRLAHLFARDQMQRFNKSCTLATFRAAGVTKVKWVTANDGRVRNRGYTDNSGVYHRAHTRLQGMVFSVNSLPVEIDDYNCRCGLVPVEWAE